MRQPVIEPATDTRDSGSILAAILTPRVVNTEKLSQRVLESPSGLWVGKMGDDNMSQLQTKDRKISLLIAEMQEWMAEITQGREAQALTPDPEYPFILNAGRHTPGTANTLMRNSIWNKGRKGQALIPHGFGLKYRGEVYGINVNRLTKNTLRDRIAATPLHRYVPC